MKIHSDRVWILALVLFFAGGVVLFVGDLWEVAALQGLGWITFAAAPLLIGLHAVATRRLTLATASRHDKKEFHGIGAVAAGTLFLLMGGVISVIALAKWLRYEPDQLIYPSGLILAGLGLLAILYGVGQLALSVTHRGQKISLFWTWRYKVGGVLAILIGFALLPAGLLWTFAPERFFALRQAAFEWFLTTLRKLLGG